MNRLVAWENSSRHSRLPSDWSSLRRKVLKRDGYICQLCGDSATEVDHIVPGDNHSMTNLRALCPRCHSTKSGREGAAASNKRKRQMRDRFKRGEGHPGETR